MMTVQIAQLKNQLSKHLRAVEHGAEVEVRDRDRAIARIVPVRNALPAPVIEPALRAFSTIRSKRFRPVAWGREVVETLLHDRRHR